MRYWKARALVALGDPLAAQPIYVDLAKSPATTACSPPEEISAALPTVRALNAGALKPNEVDFKRFDQSPRRETCTKLSELGLRADRARVVQRGEGLQRRRFAGRCRWMRRKGIWDRSINTAERTKAQHDFSLRFQMPYQGRNQAATQAALTTRWCLA